MKLIPKRKSATRPRERPGGHPPTCDESAYLALEEARLVCERQHASPRNESERLRLLHRHLGMAGFYASCELRETRRRELLELARARSEKRVDATVDTESSVATLTRSARAAIEGAMKALGPRDDLHLAHVYVLGAEELLAASAPRVAAGSESSRAA